ncbi:MAG: LacI family DNA-binding transcriptional regulator [Puniceicoccaceae bacterium]
MNVQPTMRQIAKVAGVSHVTVSLALRHDRTIPKRTIERIEAIAAEMGYSPDPEVSKLMARIRKKKTPGFQGTLIWLTAWESPEAWRRWLADERFHLGAEERAAQLGYRLESFWYREPSLKPQRIASIFRERGIEGILVAALPDGMHRLEFEWEHFASVSLGYSLFEPQLNCAESAGRFNLELALQTVRMRGYQRPGLLLSHGMDERVRRAWSGMYLSDQLDRPVRERVPLLFKKEVTRALFERWFERHRPDVVISNEYEVDEWLEDLGLKVPSEIGIVRMDTAPIGRLPLEKIRWRPSGVYYSGINQKFEQIGAAAVDTLVGQILNGERGIPKDSKLVQIRGEWLDGETLLDRTVETGVSPKPGR